MHVEPKVGIINKRNPNWYRIAISFGEYKYGGAFENSVVDIVYDKEFDEWEVVWTEELENDWLTFVEYPSLTGRHTFTKLIAAKAFALDWSKHLLDNCKLDPTDYLTDDDKYIDLDVFGRKSKYYKAGMFK